jgi:hypothetical protein
VWVGCGTVFGMGDRHAAGSLGVRKTIEKSSRVEVKVERRVVAVPGEIPMEKRLEMRKARTGELCRRDMVRMCLEGRPPLSTGNVFGLMAGVENQIFNEQRDRLLTFEIGIRKSEIEEEDAVKRGEVRFAEGEREKGRLCSRVNAFRRLSEEKREKIKRMWEYVYSLEVRGVFGRSKKAAEEDLRALRAEIEILVKESPSCDEGARFLGSVYSNWVEVPCHSGRIRDSPWSGSEGLSLSPNQEPLVRSCEGRRLV